MFIPYDDPIVRQKHQTQTNILNEADGNLKKYNEIIRRKAQELRDKSPGHFKLVPNKHTLVV